jgi:two-component system cell cycle sensor histidine kinase/response regulator CckA
MAERSTSSARRTPRATAGEASLAEEDRLRRVIEDYEKEVAGLRGQLREIVRQSDERLAFFGRATHEAVWDWDFTTDTVWWNDGLRTQFGHPINADTARVEWWRQTIHPDDQARIWRTLDDRLRQELWSDEYRFRRGDGTFAHVYARGYVVRGPEGRPRRMIGAMLDITARKESEQALRDSEERLRMALDGGQIGTWDWDLRNDAVRWGGHAARVFNVMPGSAPLRFEAFLGMVHPEDRTGLDEAMRHAIAQGVPLDIEFRALSEAALANPHTSHHETRWVAAQGQAYTDDRGEPVRMLGVMQDITERKRLESQFLQAQKMEGIGRLAGGVAHDFNNLLTAVLGYIEMAGTKLERDNPAHEYFGSIRHAAERGASLTRQLLGFARRQITEPRVVDLDALVVQMQDLLRRVIGEDVELRIVTARDLGSVRLDPAQFEQVLMNLVINARDAMPNGGTLTIESRNVDLDESYARQHQGVQPGHYVMLAVSDTGMGMTEDVSRHLFEPFFTTKPPGRGTGLGLATCYGIVKQNGGHIWVYSEYGRGSTFKIFLPRTGEAAVSEAPADPASGTVAGHETVLVVEDEPMVRAISVESLEMLGYRVLQASNGEEALEVARAFAGAIDLVVSDVVMPLMGGPALVQRLRIERPHVKVLFVSGDTDDAIVRQGVLEPGVEFLQKPFALAALARRIREILGAGDGHNLLLPFDS